MQIWLRNTIYLAALLLASPWIAYRAVRTGRYLRSWRQQLFGLRPASGVPAVHGRRIWLHGVSVGEVQLLKPLWEALSRENPECQFALSTTTETGMELAAKCYPESVQKFYFPLDFSWAVGRTLKTLKPSLIVLGELEVWPNLIDMAAHHDIPLVVVNGRLSDRSFRGYRRFHRWTEPIFSKLNLVAAQSETYAQRFIECGTPAERVETTGSFKFDNVAFERDTPEVRQLRELVGLTPGHRVWVVGSTQAGEELPACQAFAVARQHEPALRLIVVPRHKERFDEVAIDLQSTGLRVLRRSSLSQPGRPGSASADWDVLLVDTIGELRWWWGTADLALVGGSFGKRGGQNMLEPAAYGINVAFGPNTSNFRDIVGLLLAADAATQLDSLEEIRPWLLRELADPLPGKERGQRAQRLIAQQQGALDRTVLCLQKCLHK
ncbi:MAG: 3-deoxy-D-manno-octulosonic acid transferase [Pirellulaceae bacterium]